MISPPPRSEKELNRLHVTGNYAQLIVADRENLAYFLHECDSDHRYVGNAISRLAWTLYENGDFAAAENELLRGMIDDVKDSEEFKKRSIAFLHDLANIYLATDRVDDADSAVKRSNELLASMSVAPMFRRVISLLYSARIHMCRRELADAERLLNEAADEAVTEKRPNDRVLGIILHRLGQVYEAQGKIFEAVDAMRIALELYPARETAYYANSLSLLGVYVAHQGNRSAGESHLKIALEILKRVRPAGHRDIAATERRLAAILPSNGG